MRFKKCISGSLNIDAGDAAPTFNFSLTDFYDKPPFGNSWQEAYGYYKMKKPELNLEPIAFERAFVKTHTAALQEHVLTAVHHMHIKSFAEEGVETISTLCSEQFELPPPAPGDKEGRPAHMRGEAHSLANAYATRTASLEDQAAPKRAESPLHALIEIANEMARNVMRRLHGTEQILASLLVRSYIGSAMPLTIAGTLIIAYKETGRTPSAAEFQAQAKRNPGFWQPELLEQSLNNINMSDMDPALKTLAAAAEYHRNKQYFSDLDEEALLQEAIEDTDFSESAEAEVFVTGVPSGTKLGT